MKPFSIDTKRLQACYCDSFIMNNHLPHYNCRGFLTTQNFCHTGNPMAQTDHCKMRLVLTMATDGVINTRRGSVYDLLNGE